MATVIVEVTQDDIDSGEPGESYGCALYLALRRALGGCKEYGIGEDCVAHRTSHRYFDLPADAAEFVKAYDSDYVEPATFILELPE